ncbi:unnamed protein product [Lampetra fluviatilis]
MPSALIGGIEPSRVQAVQLRRTPTGPCRPRNATARNSARTLPNAVHQTRFSPSPSPPPPPSVPPLSPRRPIVHPRSPPATAKWALLLRALFAADGESVPLS